MRRRSFSRRFRVLRLTLLTSVVLVACSPKFNVTSAPAAPKDLGSFKTQSPSIPVTVQITNFSIGRVDTQYTEEEKDLYRNHFSVAIPNMLQEFMGKRQVFSEVTRVENANPASAKYIMSGDYNFFERLGTQGREWIPFAGTFGADINEAWVKGDLGIRIIDARTGAEVFRKRYPEEHRKRTSIYQPAQVGYLQANYVSVIVSEVIAEITKLESSNAGSSQQP